MDNTQLLLIMCFLMWFIFPWYIPLIMFFISKLYIFKKIDDFNQTIDPKNAPRIMSLY